MLKAFKNKLWGGKPKEKVLVCEGSGSWLEYIQFDGQIYWTIDDERPRWVMSNDPSLPEGRIDYILPSDSQYRADMAPLRRKEYDVAEKEKTALEEL